MSQAATDASSASWSSVRWRYRAPAKHAVGSGASTSHLPSGVQGALNETYVYALSKGLYAIGSLALLGALLAWVLMGRPARTPVSAPSPGAQPVHPLERPAERAVERAHA